MVSISSALRRFVSLALALVTAPGCVRTVQAWPPPLPSDTPVRVRFTTQRVVIFDRGTVQDTLANVKELRGRVVVLHGDTLVLRVSGDRSPNDREARAPDRQTTIILDPATVVSRTQVDSWKIAYGLLAGVVLIFSALVISSG